MPALSKVIGRVCLNWERQRRDGLYLEEGWGWHQSPRCLEKRNERTEIRDRRTMNRKDIDLRPTKRVMNGDISKLVAQNKSTRKLEAHFLNGQDIRSR